ncbi:MAG: hypothetical protein ACJ8IR_03360 [Alphaproteobacteria bacterium]|jgi:hypothetical protein
MAMGEGKRRRRMEEGEASGSLEATVDTTAESDAPEGQQAVAQRRRRARMNQRPAVQPVSESPSEPQISDATAAISSKPVALAEILANPSLAMRPIGEQANIGSAQPAASAEPAIEAAQPTFENSRAETSVREPDMTERNDASAPYASGELPGHSPEPSHGESRRTREPAILALLLVALIMLAFNTYFTMRLNGLSDRLSAMAGGNAAAGSVADRPWVGVDNIKTTPFANGGQPVTNVHIVNSGREPAYDLRSNTVGSLRSATTAAPDIPGQKGPLATTGLLLPNTGGNLTFFANTRALTAEEAKNVQSGQYVLWLAGRLDYKDARGRPHGTTFRYRYNPSLNAFIAAPEGNLAN